MLAGTTFTSADYPVTCIALFAGPTLWFPVVTLFGGPT